MVKLSRPLRFESSFSLYHSSLPMRHSTSHPFLSMGNTQHHLRDFWAYRNDTRRPDFTFGLSTCFTIVFPQETKRYYIQTPKRLLKSWTKLVLGSCTSRKKGSGPPSIQFFQKLCRRTPRHTVTQIVILMLAFEFHGTQHLPPWISFSSWLPFASFS